MNYLILVLMVIMPLLGLFLIALFYDEKHSDDSDNSNISEIELIFNNENDKV